MSLKIALQIKSNRYDTYRYNTYRLAKAFEARGAKTVIIDPIDQEGLLLRTLYLRHPELVDFTCSFGWPPFEKEQNLNWEKCGIPHLYLLTDPAVWNYQMLKGDNLYVASVDQFECDYVRRFLPDSNVFFLPHGTDHAIKYRKHSKVYDVIFCGACYDHITVEKLIRERFNNEWQAAIFEAITFSNQLPIWMSLEQAMRHQKMEPTPENIQKAHIYVDAYIRSKERYDLICAISSCHVHVFGESAFETHEDFQLRGWAELLADRPNVIIHPAVSYEDTIEIMKHSKIVLCSMPFVKNGSNERILDALACGSLPFVTENLWVKVNFVKHEEIAVYRLEEMEKIDEQIQALLSDIVKRQEMVRAGRSRVMKYHTWENRADQILKWMTPIVKESEYD